SPSTVVFQASAALSLGSNIQPTICLGVAKLFRSTWQRAIDRDPFSFRLPNRTLETGQSPPALPCSGIRRNSLARELSFHRTLQRRRDCLDRRSISLTRVKRISLPGIRTAHQFLPAHRCLSFIASDRLHNSHVSVSPIRFPNRT